MINIFFYILHVTPLDLLKQIMNLLTFIKKKFIFLHHNFIIIIFLYLTFQYHESVIMNYLKPFKI